MECILKFNYNSVVLNKLSGCSMLLKIRKRRDYLFIFNIRVVDEN